MAKVRRGEIRHGNLIAGAVAENEGILIGWEGKDELAHARFCELMTAAGVKRAWLPKAKEPGTQLSRAVRAVAGGTYNTEEEKKRDRQVAEARDWSKRWMLVARTTDGLPTAGERFGEIELVVTLYTDKPQPELVFDTKNEALADRVRDEFWRRVNEATHVAGDVTKWLNDLIKLQLEGVRYGGNWYVPRLHRSLAEAICETLYDAGWGRKEAWMRPPLPIATSAQLSLGVALSLQGEVDDVLLELQELREAQWSEGKPDITETQAETIMRRLRGVGERICGYANILGADRADDCRDRIHDAMVELDGILGAHDFNQEWKRIADARARKGAVL